MSYRGGPGYGGYGHGSMPMPFGQRAQTYPAATPYPSQPPAAYPNQLPATYPNQPPTSYTHNSSTTSYPTHTAPYPIGTPQQPPAVNTNELDLWMDSLIANLNNLIKNASKTELDQLINNEDKLNELLQDAEQTKKLQRKREEIIQQNKDQAVTNMSLEPELGLLKTSLTELAKQQNELKEKHISLQKMLAGKVSLDSVSAILQAATAEKETDSDKLSQEFLDGNKSLNEFLEEFIPERKAYQLRKIKSEKMTQLMQSGAININRPTPMPRPRTHQTGYSGYGGY